MDSSKGKPMGSMFSPDVEAILRAAGWSEEREVRIRKWVTPLERCGVSVSDKAKEALRQLGGLHIIPRRGEGCAYWAEDVYFGGIKRCSTGVDEMQEYEQEYAIALCPIGRVGLHEIVCVAPGGEVYGAGPYLLWYGRNLPDALECMLAAKRRPIVEDEPGFPPQTRG